MVLIYMTRVTPSKRSETRNASSFSGKIDKLGMKGGWAPYIFLQNLNLIREIAIRFCLGRTFGYVVSFIPPCLFRL